MDLDIVRAELEQDLSWRLDEVRFLQNQAASLDDQSVSRYRRALVLILYSHFEGYCKFCFLHYIKTLNNLGIKCSEANEALAAATLSLAFQGLRDTQRKNPLFRRQLPDDPALHRFAREREFVAEVAQFIERRRTPPHIRAELDIAFRMQGQSIEIFEIRPHWEDKNRFLEHPVAKATYIGTKQIWKVYWMRPILNGIHIRLMPRCARSKIFWPSLRKTRMDVFSDSALTGGRISS